MEPKQNYLLVGSFVFAIALAIVVFVIWLASAHQHGDIIKYQSFFKESVNGLTLGSPVKYRGVDVGKVVVIEIASDDPSKVRIEMDINRNAPITDKIVSVLQVQAITGSAYIELREMKPTDKLIGATDNGYLPVIPSAPSEFRQIVDSVPEMLQKFNDLATSLNGFASADNKQHFSEILVNLKQFSDGVGIPDENGLTLVQELQKAVKEISDTAVSVNAVTTNSRNDVQRLLKNSAETIDKLSKLADKTGTLSEKGYQDVNSSLLELKKTARDLQNLSRELKENPSKIVIPTQAGGVDVQ